MRLCVRVALLCTSYHVAMYGMVCVKGKGMPDPDERVPRFLGKTAISESLVEEVLSQLGSQIHEKRWE